MKKLLFLLLLFSISFNLRSQILLGTSTEGGPNNNGLVFTVDVSNDEFEIINTFPDIKSLSWYGFVNAANGKTYCLAGNFWTEGELIEYDPVSGDYSVLVSFDDSTGSFPRGLVYDSVTNSLYGTNKFGGTYNEGVIYKYSLDNYKYEILYTFNGATGIKPDGNILLVNDSLIYGVTYGAYSIGPGVVYSFNILNNEYSDLSYFNNDAGSNKSGIFKANNGKFYGTTYLGGANGDGMLFEFDPETNTLIKLFDFVDSTGSWAMTKLVEPVNGKLYGLTYYGGLYYSGVIFEFDYLDGVYTVKHNFDYEGGLPIINIAQLDDGKLYGATTSGANYGKIFSYDVVNETFQYVYDFDINTGGEPTGEFFTCSNSEIITVTTSWAAYGKGALLNFDMDNYSVEKNFDFTGNSESKIYGTPYYKNENIYILSNNYDEFYDNYSNLLLVDYNQNNKSVVVDAFTNGSGGLSVFEDKLYYFSNYSDSYNIRVFDIEEGKVVATPGGQGTGHMTLADDGYLYGMKIPWGENPFKIFKFDPNTYSLGTVLNHYGPNKPKPYENSLTAGSDGMLYGVAAYSGADSSGVIFEFNIDSEEYVELFDFSNSTALNPSGELVEVEDSVFYAMTQLGGDYGAGTIFRFIKSTNTVEIVHSFAGADGANPTGSLMLASNGKLYGMTTNGGAFDLGVVFEFDPVTGDYNKILDFNGENGSHPRYSALTEICDEPEILSNPQDVEAVEGDTVMFVVSAESDDLTGYQWYHFTNPVIGATDDTLIIAGVSAEDEGQYYCEVSATCVSVKSETAGLTIVTGIDEKESKIGIYPNPVRDVLNLTFPTTGKSIEVNIYNYRGQLLLSGEITGSGTVKYDVSDLSPGLYVVKVVSEEKSTFAKFVKN